MGLKEAEKYLCSDQTNITCSKKFDSLAVNFILYLIYMTAIILATFGNLVVIIIIAHFKQLHTPTNVLTLSMAVVDFLIGIFLMPVNLVINMDTCWHFGNVICMAVSFCLNSLTVISVSHLIFLSIDRYCAVCYPLLYSTKVTLQTAWIFVSLTWISSLCYSIIINYLVVTYLFSEAGFCEGFCLYMMYATITTVDLVYTFFLPFTIMLALYSRIFIVATGHAKAIRHIENKRGVVKKTKRVPDRQNKATITIGIVISNFFLFFFPLCFLHLLQLFKVKSSLTVQNALEQLSLFNFAFNPIIYGLFYPWFRKGFKLILTCQIFKTDSSLTSLFSENK